MGHGHGHSHGGFDQIGADAPRVVRLVIIVAVVAAALVSLAGLFVLWPDDDQSSLPPELGVPVDLVDATVRSVVRGPCFGSEPDESDCDIIEAEVTSGATKGDTAAIELSLFATNPRLHPGDRIVLGYDSTVAPEFAYYFADYQRRTPLMLLGVVFVASVVLLGRLRGIGALAGLAASVAVLVYFVLPALLDGSSPVAVALVGSSVVGFIALYLAHGINLRTSIALLGTFASLVLTGVLAAMFVGAAHFTGLSEEASLFLFISTDVDLKGLLLAGIVIGSLGVLDDVTVTQVSAVWELKTARPSADFYELYSAALRIGRDHISSTVNTLVLAYAGASLPLLLMFTQYGQNLADAANGEVIAIEIVRALVGSIGLVASVPITTALAAVVAAHRASPVPADE